MNVNNILIADDSELMRTLVSDYLSRNQSYRVFTATDGNEACEIAFKEPISIIVMDWDMPVMNGLEAIRILRQHEKTKDIPIIIFTAVFTDSEHLVAALQNGAVDFLRKPVEMIELNARIRSMLRITDYRREIIQQKEQIFIKDRSHLENVNDFQKLMLLSKTMQMAQMNEFLSELLIQVTELNNVNKKFNKEAAELKRKIENKINKESWNEFKFHFDELHNDFLIRLQNKYPDLSPNNLKLCAFLRMNLSTKEISKLTYQPINTIDTARTRLRRKLNLTKEDNLTTFLIRF